LCLVYGSSYVYNEHHLKENALASATIFAFAYKEKGITWKLDLFEIVIRFVI
jgi:hypothetical protein